MPISSELLERLKNQDPTLNKLHFQTFFAENELTPQDIKILVQAAKNNPYIKTIILNNQEIGDEGCKWLSELKQIENLALSNNNISDEGIQYLSQIKELKEVILSNNKITDKGLALLLKLPHIKSLVLEENPITKEGALFVLKNTHLQEIILDSTIGEEILKKINDHLERNIAIQEKHPSQSL